MLDIIIVLVTNSYFVFHMSIAHELKNGTQKFSQYYIKRMKVYDLKLEFYHLRSQKTFALLLSVSAAAYQTG